MESKFAATTPHKIFITGGQKINPFGVFCAGHLVRFPEIASVNFLKFWIKFFCKFSEIFEASSRRWWREEQVRVGSRVRRKGSLRRREEA
jgi:hypothetical protein